MVNVLVLKAMANDKATAESVVTAHLPQVLDNLAKIYLYRSSTSTTKEWTDEIADKHLRRINTVVNNVATKKGHLSSDVLLRLWWEAITDRNFRAAVRAASRAPQYAKLKKYDVDEQSLCFTLEVLRAQANWFAKEILDPELAQDDLMAEHLAKQVLRF